MRGVWPVQRYPLHETARHAVPFTVSNMWFELEVSKDETWLTFSSRAGLILFQMVPVPFIECFKKPGKHNVVAFTERNTLLQMISCVANSNSVSELEIETGRHIRTYKTI